MEYLYPDKICPEKIVFYEKEVQDETNENMYNIHRRICLLSEDDKQCHKYCSFNLFKSEPEPIPSSQEGWKTYIEIAVENYNEKHHESFDAYMTEIVESHHKMVKKSVYDPTAKRFKLSSILNPETLGKFTMYKTLDNYEIGFVVYFTALRFV